MNSKEIRGLLARRYQPPTYAFFSEVSDGTGGMHSRYADAVACGLYPSQGLEIEGFEIKSVRSDWLNELKHPEKSNAVMQYCHRWWIVAPKGVLAAAELPKSWGYIELRGEKFWTLKHAPELQAKVPDQAFLASLFRRATENVVPKESVWAVREERRAAGRKEMQEEVDRANSQLCKYKEQVKQFEEASGISILEQWKSGKEIGEAAKFIMDGGARTLDYRVGDAMSNTKAILKQLMELEVFSKNIKKLDLKQ